MVCFYASLGKADARNEGGALRAGGVMTTPYHPVMANDSPLT